MRTYGGESTAGVGLLALLLALSPLGGIALADAPALVRYQAHLSDAAGIPVTGTHDLAFAIYDASTGGTPIWAEGPRAVVLDDGVLDVLLGEVTPLPSSLFTASARWLEVTVDGAILSPRQRLSSVPFAHAADRLGDLTLVEVLDRQGHTGTQSPTTIAPQGSGSGLDADRLDGLEAGNAAGQIPISNGTLNASLNADQLDGLEASELIAAAQAGVVYDSGEIVASQSSSGVFGPLDMEGRTRVSIQIYVDPVSVATLQLVVKEWGNSGSLPFSGVGNTHDCTTTDGSGCMGLDGTGVPPVGQSNVLLSSVLGRELQLRWTTRANVGTYTFRFVVWAY